MPRSALDPTLALAPLDRFGPEPLQRQLYLALREAILGGRLAAGARLPSTRRLAAHLRLGRNTVLAAFAHLLADGFIEARRGAGTVVAAAPGPLAPSQSPQAGRPLSRRAMMLMEVETPRAHGWGGTLAPGTPDLAHFPFREWARLLSRRWRRPGRDLLVPGDPAGYQPLRTAIAEWLGRTRAVRCTPEQVLIVSGSQQALDLTARVLLDPGDIALIEDPGYAGIKGALRAAGAEVAPVPLDDAGFDVQRAERSWPSARLAWVTPSHQFPTGVIMPVARRLALVDWARRCHGWIIEDDYDGEFRHAGPPLAALQGLDAAQRTLHLGTFSKSMFPGLRLGWMVLPPDLVAPFKAVRSLADMAPPSLTQAAMADFMAEGLFAAHLKRMRGLYKARRAYFQQACARHLSGLGTLAPGDAGLHSILWLAEGVDDRAAAIKAKAAGFDVPPLSGFRLNPGPPGLVLGWGNIEEAAMNAAAKRLAAALA